MPDYSFEPSDDGVYWFARDFVATEYGNFGVKNPGIAREVQSVAADFLDGEYDGNFVDAREEIESIIINAKSRTHRGSISKVFLKTQNLADRVVARLDEASDLRELELAIEIVTATSDLMDQSPVFEPSMVRDTVEETLGDPPEEDNAYAALYECDLRGEAYQVGGQRVPLAEFLAGLRDQIEDDYDEENIERIVSAAAQEYERRVGQSRAASAGNVLETALDHLFHVFDIDTTGKPQHYGDFEVDNEVFGPEGSIGFTCKRSQRERFKQSLPRESEIDVDEIWFITLQHSDISGSKLDILDGVGRLYVPRSSYLWDYYKDEYSASIFPADEFISDVREFTGQ